MMYAFNLYLKLWIRFDHGVSSSGRGTQRNEVAVLADCQVYDFSSSPNVRVKDRVNPNPSPPPHPPSRCPPPPLRLWSEAPPLTRLRGAGPCCAEPGGSQSVLSAQLCYPTLCRCLLLSPALLCPVEGYKERGGQHEIETEHESGGGSRGTQQTQPDYSLVHTRILLSPDWIRSSADVRTGFHPPKSVETGGRGADFITQVGFFVGEMRPEGCSSFLLEAWNSLRESCAITKEKKKITPADYCSASVFGFWEVPHSSGSAGESVREAAESCWWNRGDRCSFCRCSAAVP